LEIKNGIHLIDGVREAHACLEGSRESHTLVDAGLPIERDASKIPVRFVAGLFRVRD
jgi:hypothetical protein